MASITPHQVQRGLLAVATLVVTDALAQQDSVVAPVKLQERTLRAIQLYSSDRFDDCVREIHRSLGVPPKIALESYCHDQRALYVLACAAAARARSGTLALELARSIGGARDVYGESLGRVLTGQVPGIMNFVDAAIGDQRLLDLGTHAFEKKELEKANSILTQLLISRSDLDEARVLRAMVAIERGELALAQIDLHAVVASGQTSFDAQILLGKFIPGRELDAVSGVAAAQRLGAQDPLLPSVGRRFLRLLEFVNDPEIRRRLSHHAEALAKDPRSCASLLVGRFRYGPLWPSPNVMASSVMGQADRDESGRSAAEVWSPLIASLGARGLGIEFSCDAAKLAEAEDPISRTNNIDAARALLLAWPSLPETERLYSAFSFLDTVARGVRNGTPFTGAQLETILATAVIPGSDLDLRLTQPLPVGLHGLWEPALPSLAKATTAMKGRALGQVLAEALESIAASPHDYPILTDSFKEIVLAYRQHPEYFSGEHGRALIAGVITQCRRIQSPTALLVRALFGADAPVKSSSLLWKNESGRAAIQEVATVARLGEASTNGSLPPLQLCRDRIMQLIRLGSTEPTSPSGRAPWLWEAHFTAGKLLVELRDYRAAVVHLEQAISSAPKAQQESSRALLVGILRDHGHSVGAELEDRASVAFPFSRRSNQSTIFDQESLDIGIINVPSTLSLVEVERFAQAVLQKENKDLQKWLPTLSALLCRALESPELQFTVYNGVPDDDTAWLARAVSTGLFDEHRNRLRALGLKAEIDLRLGRHEPVIRALSEMELLEEEIVVGEELLGSLAGVLPRQPMPDPAEKLPAARTSTELRKKLNDAISREPDKSDLLPNRPAARLDPSEAIDSALDLLWRVDKPSTVQGVASMSSLAEISIASALSALASGDHQRAAGFAQKALREAAEADPVRQRMRTVRYVGNYRIGSHGSSGLSCLRREAPSPSNTDARHMDIVRAGLFILCGAANEVGAYDQSFEAACRLLELGGTIPEFLAGGDGVGSVLWRKTNEVLQAAASFRRGRDALFAGRPFEAWGEFRQIHTMLPTLSEVNEFFAAADALVSFERGHPEGATTLGSLASKSPRSVDEARLRLHLFDVWYRTGTENSLKAVATIEKLFAASPEEKPEPQHLDVSALFLIAAAIDAHPLLDPVLAKIGPRYARSLLDQAAMESGNLTPKVGRRYQELVECDLPNLWLAAIVRSGGLDTQQLVSSLMREFPNRQKEEEEPEARVTAFALTPLGIWQSMMPVLQQLSNPRAPLSTRGVEGPLVVEPSQPIDLSDPIQEHHSATRLCFVNRTLPADLPRLRIEPSPYPLGNATEKQQRALPEPRTEPLRYVPWLMVEPAKPELLKQQVQSFVVEGSTVPLPAWYLGEMPAYGEILTQWNLQAKKIGSPQRENTREFSAIDRQWVESTLPDRVIGKLPTSAPQTARPSIDLSGQEPFADKMNDLLSKMGAISSTLGPVARRYTVAELSALALKLVTIAELRSHLLLAIPRDRSIQGAEVFFDQLTARGLLTPVPPCPERPMAGAVGTLPDLRALPREFPIAAQGQPDANNKPLQVTFSLIARTVEGNDCIEQILISDTSGRLHKPFSVVWRGPLPQRLADLVAVQPRLLPYYRASILAPTVARALGLTCPLQEASLVIDHPIAYLPMLLSTMEIEQLVPMSIVNRWIEAKLGPDEPQRYEPPVPAKLVPLSWDQNDKVGAWVRGYAAELLSKRLDEYLKAAPAESKLGEQFPRRIPGTSLHEFLPDTPESLLQLRLRVTTLRDEASAQAAQAYAKSDNFLELLTKNITPNTTATNAPVIYRDSQIVVVQIKGGMVALQRPAAEASTGAAPTGCYVSQPINGPGTSVELPTVGLADALRYASDSLSRAADVVAESIIAELKRGHLVGKEELSVLLRAPLLNDVTERIIKTLVAKE